MKYPILNSKNESKKLLASSFIMAILFNMINFNSLYFYSLFHFAVFTIIFMLQCYVLFKLYKEIPGLLLKILPYDKDKYKRLACVICIFILINGLLLFATFQLYGYVSWFRYSYNENVFLWNFLAFTIINIFLSLLIEGLRSFNEWRENTKYNENLNTSYSRSRLDALKSQVNPHFLFNSLNSLSSLIQEDQEKAEIFLDEMSKIYRYMLRTEDEIYVRLETELSFINSYYHLLNARYGEGLQLNISVEKQVFDKLIAPHSLQVIIENAFTQNVVSKHTPLKIEIFNQGNNLLIIKNNIQSKTISEVLDFEVGLDNLVRKYRLLGTNLKIEDDSNQLRTITIPLSDKSL